MDRMGESANTSKNTSALQSEMTSAVSSLHDNYELH